MSVASGEPWRWDTAATIAVEAELPITDVIQRPVPGAAFDPAQTVHDASDRHTLHSREHA